MRYCPPPVEVPEIAPSDWPSADKVYYILHRMWPDLCHFDCHQVFLHKNAIFIFSVMSKLWSTSGSAWKTVLDTCQKLLRHINQKKFFLPITNYQQSCDFHHSYPRKLTIKIINTVNTGTKNKTHNISYYFLLNKHYVLH